MQRIDLDHLDDGRAVVEAYRLADGIILAVLPDGTRVVIEPDGSVIETPAPTA